MLEKLPTIVDLAEVQYNIHIQTPGYAGLTVSAKPSPESLSSLPRPAIRSVSHRLAGFTIQGLRPNTKKSLPSDHQISDKTFGFIIIILK